VARKIEQPVEVAKVLKRNGLSLRRAHETLNRLAHGERVPIEIACDARVLISELSALGVDACVANVPIPDVKRIREQLGLSQSDFALRFGLDVDAIRNWEQQRTAPDTAARVLLAVVDKYPWTVEATLNNQK